MAHEAPPSAFIMRIAITQKYTFSKSANMNSLPPP